MLRECFQDRENVFNGKIVNKLKSENNELHIFIRTLLFLKLRSLSLNKILKKFHTSNLKLFIKKKKKYMSSIFHYPKRKKSNLQILHVQGWLSLAKLMDGSIWQVFKVQGVNWLKRVQGCIAH